MADALTDYVNVIAKTPLLTSSEEIHLGTCIQKWLQSESADHRLARSGRRALDRMVTANLRLVVSYVMRTKHRLQYLGIDLLDAIQETNYGLVTAARRFDPKRGYRFSTYAFWWIKDALTRYMLTNHGFIYIPMNILRLSAKAKTMLSKPEHFGSLVSVASALEVSPDKLRSCLYIVEQSSMSSLDKIVSHNDSDLSFIDFISNDIITELNDDYDWLYAVIGKLSDLEKTFISLRFGQAEEKPLSLIAKELGFSKYQTLRLQNRVLSKLRSQVEPMLSLTSLSNN